MDLGLAGLNVLITGASGGIGWSAAEAFAAEDAGLLLHAATREQPLRERVPDAWAAMVHGAELRDPGQADALVAAGVARFGRLDAVIVNAGIWPPSSEPLHTMSVQRINDVLDVNLRGAIWTVRAFMAALAEAGPREDGRGASVCFIGSTAGRFGEAGHVAYSASKAAMTGLVHTLKNEIVQLDPYARVNMVEPGWVATPMARAALDVPGAIEGATRTMALRQIARPEDIARAIVMLTSPALSRHVSGQTLTVAGGMEGRVLWGAGEIDAEAVRSRLDAD